MGAVRNYPHNFFSFWLHFVMNMNNDMVRKVIFIVHLRLYMPNSKIDFD